MNYKVKLAWDDDARVWVATSDSIKGLVLESGSYDALIEKIKIAIPELVELNGDKKVNSISFESDLKTTFDNVVFCME